MNPLKLFKTPTRNPEMYDADKAELLCRVRELEEVVEKYRTKCIGPYTVTITINAPQWGGVVGCLKSFAVNAERCGPGGLGLAGGSSDGTSFNISIKSNMQGGHGETDADLADPEPARGGEATAQPPPLSPQHSADTP